MEITNDNEIEQYTKLSVFGRNLKKIRKARSLTQVELALQAGYESTGTISQFEISAPSLKKVFLMAKILDVPVQILLSDVEYTSEEIKAITMFIDVLKNRDKLRAFDGAHDLIKMMHKYLSSKKII